MTDADLATSGTTLRFALLILLLLASTASMIGDTILPVMVTSPGAGFGICMLAAGIASQAPATAVLKVLLTQDEALQICYARFGADTTPWWRPTAAAAAVVLAAAVLYLVLPAWKSRRGRGIPVGEGPEDELGRLLSELAARADVKGVRFTVDPAVATTGAVAFGRPGRYVVRLHGGLLARRYADPAGFEAVVLHELAHVRSGDVRLAYATTALWRAFLVGVLLPYVALKASFLFTAFTSGGGSVHWQGAVPFLSRALILALLLTLLLTLARADLLRNRELYADLAAVRWGASKSVWSRYDDGRARGRRWMIGDLWRTHPSWERRRRSLNDPTALSGSLALPMLLTGIAALLTTTTLSPILPDPAMATVGVLVVAGVVAGIVVMASGLAAARAVAAGRRLPSGVRAGVWFGIGLLVAALVLQQTNLRSWLPEAPEVLLVLPVAAVVTCWWSTECVGLWVRTRTADRPFRPVLLTATVATWVVTAAWLSWWHSYGSLLLLGEPFSPAVFLDWLRSFGGPAEPGGVVLSAVSEVFPHLITVAFDPLWRACAGVLLFYPLLALVWRPDPLTDRPSVLRLLWAAVAGAAAGWGVMIAAMAYMHSWQPPSLTGAAQYTTVYLWLLFTALMTSVVVAAALVSWTARRYRMVTGLIAGGLASPVALGGALIIGSYDGCLGSLNTLSSSCSWNPAPIWDVLKVDVPLLIGMTMPAAAVTVLVFGLWKNRFRGGWWMTRGGGGLGARRMAVASLSVAVFFLVFFFGTWAGPAGGLPSTVRTFTAEDFLDQVPPFVESAELRREQRRAWVAGGMDLFRGLVRDFGSVDEAMGAQGFGQPERIVMALRTLIAGVERAGRYFPVPDAAEQRVWAEVLAGMEREATGALNALDREDQAAFGESMKRLKASMEQMVDLAERLATTAPG
ncbi:M48 family metalloprotease [Streptosporangium sp. NPDC002544]|uniref:M48 family metalloprotease n=1 Tax=Streptosporangium sp. NPDC002544 TaxID=3154538 RepID=UPI00332FC38A